MRNGDLDPGDTDYAYDHDYDRALPALSRSFVPGEGMPALAEIEIRTTLRDAIPGMATRSHEERSIAGKTLRRVRTPL